MRKLTPTEAAALHFLVRDGSICPGSDLTSLVYLRSVLDSLVKKKRATVTVEDDGPVYHAIPGVLS